MDGHVRLLFFSSASVKSASALLSRKEPTASEGGSELMNAQINIFEKPIERIKKTCDLMGLGADFEQRLPELETYLESLVADGETSEDRLTVNGLAFLKGDTR
ncbi:hypothetical protein ACTGJ9_033390 [Bradyrhizobium sp. RDM12]